MKSQFDLRIFFQMGWLKPPTRHQRGKSLGGFTEIPRDPLEDGPGVICAEDGEICKCNGKASRSTKPFGNKNTTKRNKTYILSKRIFFSCCLLLNQKGLEKKRCLDKKCRVIENCFCWCIRIHHNSHPSAFFVSTSSVWRLLGFLWSALGG